MRNGMDGKSDTVLHADLAHEFRQMGFHGSLFNSQNRTDFLVGTASDQQLQHFFFAIRESNAACGKNSTGRGSDPLNENGEHASWRPNCTLIPIPLFPTAHCQPHSYFDISLSPAP